MLMRPVTKVGQGAYLPMIDVTSQANLNTTLSNFTIAFGPPNEEVRDIWKTTDPTANEVLGGLLLLAQPSKKRKRKVDQIRLLKGKLATRLSVIYGTASGPLQEQLGRFCSFCEYYFQSGLAVEHIAAKAPYPLFYIAWDNFLLACPVCNSSKLSKPPRNDPLFAPPPVAGNEVGYFTTIKDSYLWPQWFTGIYRATKPVLEYQYTDEKWYVVTYPVAAGTELTTQDELTRTLKADVCTHVVTAGTNQATWLLDVPVRVLVSSTGSRSIKMVELVGLNKPSGNDKKAGGEADIRMWSRTMHWFTVLESFNDLKGVKDPQTFELLWNMLMKSVRQPGLYSVWVTVLDLFGLGGSWTVPGTATPLMTRFLTEIAGKNFFPGTDTADTP